VVEGGVGFDEGRWEALKMVVLGSLQEEGFSDRTVPP